MANFVFLAGELSHMPKKYMSIDTQDGKNTGKKYVITVDTKTQLIRESEKTGKYKYKYIYEPVKVILYGRKVDTVMQWQVGDSVQVYGKITGRIEHIKGLKNPIRISMVIADEITNMSLRNFDEDEMIYVKNSVKGVGGAWNGGEKPETVIKKRKDLEEEYDIDDDYIIEF